MSRWCPTRYANLSASPRSRGFLLSGSSPRSKWLAIASAIIHLALSLHSSLLANDSIRGRSSAVSACCLMWPSYGVLLYGCVGQIAARVYMRPLREARLEDKFIAILKSAHNILKNEAAFKASHSTQILQNWDAMKAFSSFFCDVLRRILPRPVFYWDALELLSSKAFRVSFVISYLCFKGTGEEELLHAGALSLERTGKGQLSHAGAPFLLLAVEHRLVQLLAHLPNVAQRNSLSWNLKGQEKNGYRTLVRRSLKGLNVWCNCGYVVYYHRPARR
ncbi:hypothetical protein B0H12DRAFT_131102 [Mycena haematopus]|nr:hypothetical protein B0H12DRAFT_131102 [Mycena haematopus]